MKNMDTEKFGKFIAACRMDNHMTQKELAQKLQVTDKAVSRWERGKGFPDISFLVPLSEALNISVPELMKSERDDTKREVFSAGEIRNVLTSASQMEKQNKREARLLSALISPVTVIVALWVVLLEKGSLLVGLWLGLAVALAIAGIVFLLSREAGHRFTENIQHIYADRSRSDRVVPVSHGSRQPVAAVRAFCLHVCCGRCGGEIAMRRDFKGIFTLKSPCQMS